MRSFIAILLSLVLSAVAAVYFAGVTLFIENRTGEPLEDIAIDYGRGRVEVGKLAPHHGWSERVGKIGEGVRLELSFRQRGKQLRSSVGIYLPDCDGFIRTWITFQIMNASRVRTLCDGDSVEDEPAVPVDSSPL